MSGTVRPIKTDRAYVDEDGRLLLVKEVVIDCPLGREVRGVLQRPRPASTVDGELERYSTTMRRFVDVWRLLPARRAASRQLLSRVNGSYS